jgi:uncharacterized repeat protein (TIGR02543 family)
MRPKRLISLLVAVCMMVAMLPFSAVPAFAADTLSFTIDDIQYTIDKNDSTAVSVTGTTGYGDENNKKDLVLPETVEYNGVTYTVTSIGNGAFARKNGLNSIVIPNTVVLIAESAFASNWGLASIEIPASVVEIGTRAFEWAGNIAEVKFAANSQLKILGTSAFSHAKGLKSIELPEGLTTIKNCAFADCNVLESVTIPASVTTIMEHMFDNPSNPTGGCPMLKTVKYAGTKEQWDKINLAENNDILTSTLEVLCNITFDVNGYGTAPADQTVYTGDKLVKVAEPTAAGYTFGGWYTDKELTKAFDVENDTVSGDTTLYAKWKAIPDHELTVKVGTFTYDDNAASDKGNVYEGALVTVTFDENNQLWKDSGLSFDHWDIQSKANLLDENGEEIVNPGKTFTFVMPKEGVTIEAMPKDATIEEEEEPNVLGTAAIIGTAAVGTAVLGYQAYSLGTEFAGKLMALPYFPSNRSALAMMLWEDAGKPMPESELLYPDVEQEEQDMDLQHAARWAMENELIPDLNDEGTAPEEMKFFPANPVSKLDVLNAWQKAQELKNN